MTEAVLQSLTPGACGYIDDMGIPTMQCTINLTTAALFAVTGWLGAQLAPGKTFLRVRRHHEVCDF